MTKLGERLPKSAKQTRAIAQAETPPARTVHGTIPASAVHAEWMKAPDYAAAYEESGPRMEREFETAEARARGKLA